MARYVVGTVTEVLSERPGLQRVVVATDTEPAARAYVVTQLTASVTVGDEVLCNTTAVELGLGTGGWHVVAANLTRGGFTTPGGGHIMKLRYTPMQLDSGAAEEHLSDLDDRLEAMPVVACTVHSQVPVAVLGVLQAAPAARIAYVMTDGAALPIAFSGLVAEMTERGWLRAGTITAGHAFGGTREAVGVPSALAVARHDAGADVVVVGMGPGVVGTGHRLGTTALEAVPVLDAAAALGGDPILCVRASSGDARIRHQGVSHHARTVLELVRSAVTVPHVPDLGDALAPFASRHDLVEVPEASGAALLEAAELRVTTMGRTPDADAWFFDMAAAAGICAGRRARPRDDATVSDRSR